jgi:hypothetical protein
VTNTSGTVAPGASPGTLTVGSFTQGSGGTLAIEVDGTAPGTQHDVLAVTGAAALDGTVAVDRDAGFNPASSDTFQFLTSASRTGTFDTITGGSLPGGAAFSLDYPVANPFGARLVIDLPVAPTAGTPTISGTPESGQTLTCNTGTWGGNPAFGFQWLRDGAPIGGAASQTYDVVDDDRGKQLACRVTGSNAAGSAEATSAPVSVPAPAAPPAPPAPSTPAPPAATPPAPPVARPATARPAATRQETQLSQASRAAVAQAFGLPSARRCVSRRRFAIRLRVPRGVRVRSARVVVNGRTTTARRQGGRFVATVDLRGLRRGRFTVAITVETASGRTLKGSRRYRTCAPRRRA